MIAGRLPFPPLYSVLGFLMAVCAASSAAEKEDAASLQPGDKVVTLGPTSVMDGPKLVGTLAAGTELEVRKVRDSWVGIPFEKDGETKTLWVQRKDLRLATAKVGKAEEKGTEKPPGPARPDPLGFVGTWVEYWPNVPDHDISVVTYRDGQYGLQVSNPTAGPYRVAKVRVVGGTLMFTEYPGNQTIDYELRARDGNTLEAITHGGPDAGGGVIWRRETPGEVGTAKTQDSASCAETRELMALVTGPIDFKSGSDMDLLFAMAMRFGQIDGAANRL